MHYCQKLGINDPTLATLPVPLKERLLAAYALDVASGKNLKNILVREKTVENYLRAAASFATNARLPDPRHFHDHMGHRIGKSNFPLLQKLLAHIKKWQPGTAEALPITIPIIRTLRQSANASHPDSLLRCILDNVIIGTYTGSRCSEYCRGTPKNKSDRFNTVPQSPLVPHFGGSPISFIVNDFTFLTEAKSYVPWTSAGTAAYIQIRFRFDKGGTGNGSIRTFRRLPDAAADYCCVRAGLRSIHRWKRLSGDASHPLMCYQSQGSTHFLSDYHVTKALRQATITTYPDKNHIYHKHKSRVRTHSIRVTACFILVAANIPEHVIVHRLRWASAAWKVYIRECYDTIDKASLAIFSHAITDTDIPPTGTEETFPAFDSDDLL